jgi:hypothetical protein
LRVFRIIFYSKTIKIVDFLLANSHSTSKIRGLQTKNSEVFQLSFDMENVKTSTKIQKISNSRSTGTLSSRLQVLLRQSAFGVFLLGMRPISRTGHQRSLQFFLASNSAKEEKVFYI